MHAVVIPRTIDPAAWSWLNEYPQRPWCIAHRGASDHAFDNSLQAFDLAATAGADFWEVDVRTTADGQLVVFHDASLKKLGLPEVKIADTSCRDFLDACQDMGQPMPRLSDVIEQSLVRGAGLYIDAKDRSALSAAPALMGDLGVERGIIATFNGAALRELVEAECRYPCSILVRRNDDPVACAQEAGARLVHLCWEWADMSAAELDQGGFLNAAANRGLSVVLWHEERPQTLSELLTLPVRGICTNQPELLALHRP